MLLKESVVGLDGLRWYEVQGDRPKKALVRTGLGQDWLQNPMNQVKRNVPACMVSSTADNLHK
jgi:hypothetical protein